MKFVLGFLIIVLFYGLGEGISNLLPFTFPGSIIGMLLLFLSLLKGWVKLNWINSTSHFFLRYMALFFIPAGVSVICAYPLIKTELMMIILTLLLSTVVVLSVTSLLVDFFVQKSPHD